MKCPRCMNDNTSQILDSHYVCNNPECVDENGNRTQFKFIIDKKVKFPFNQIFVDRLTQEFYKKPYLEIKDTGNKNLLK